MIATNLASTLALVFNPGHTQPGVGHTREIPGQDLIGEEMPKFRNSLPFQVPHLWEVILQASMWLHLLLDQQLTTEDNVENLAELNRNVLERCGSRSSLEPCIVFLCAARMANIHCNSGISFPDIQLSLHDLFLNNPRVSTLDKFWLQNQDQQPQVLKAMDFLKFLYIRRPESRMLAQITNDMLLVIGDFFNSKPNPNRAPAALELPPR